MAWGLGAARPKKAGCGLERPTKRAQAPKLTAVPHCKFWRCKNKMQKGRVALLLKKQKSRPVVKVGVVVVAAGSSRRMGGVDKQDILLNNIPVVVRSIEPFSWFQEVEEIVVVCREEFMPQMLFYTEEFGLQKIKAIIKGGSTRQQSVMAGIQALAPDTQFYAIHDGARPFVTGDVIANCIAESVRWGAATAAGPTKDTIKIAGADGFIEATPPRESLFLTQTPQIFEAALYRRAVEEAQRQGLEFTDDCQLVENLGDSKKRSKE